MIDPMSLLIGALVTYRLTRLVTADKISEPIRGRLEAVGPRVGYLVTCDWCLSIWVGPPVAYVVDRWGTHDWVRVGLVAVALSGLTGLLSLVEGRLDN